MIYKVRFYRWSLKEKKKKKQQQTSGEGRGSSLASKREHPSSSFYCVSIGTGWSQFMKDLSLCRWKCHISFENQTNVLSSLTFSNAQNILFWWIRAADQQSADQIVSLALVRSWQNQQKLCSATETSSQIKVNLQIHVLSTDTIYVFPFCLASTCATNFIWRILVVMKHCYNLGWAKHV